MIAGCLARLLGLSQTGSVTALIGNRVPAVTAEGYDPAVAMPRRKRRAVVMTRFVAVDGYRLLCCSEAYRQRVARSRWRGDGHSSGWLLGSFSKGVGVERVRLAQVHNRATEPCAY